MRHFLIAGFVGLTLCAPAYAHDEGSTNPEVLFGGVVQERDIDLVFDYLRDALSAAVLGREAPPPPPELEQRAEAAGDEMKRRGAAAARVLIDVLEKSVREGLGEPPPRSALPPTYPQQRI
jgi:hypothetical protein